MIDDRRNWSEFNFTSTFFARVIYILVACCFFGFFSIWTRSLSSTFDDVVRQTAIDTDTINDNVRVLQSIAGVDELPAVTYTVHYADPITGYRAPSQCSSNGLFLGAKEQSYVDCDYVCKADHAGQFVYRFFHTTKSYVTQYLYNAQPGAYCVPSRLESYNPTTTTIVRGVYDWVFLPKWPSVFARENGTHIEACSGFSLYDALTNTVYSDKIPINLNVADPYNETVEYALSDMIYVTADAYNNHLTADKSEFEKGYKHARFSCTDVLVEAATGRVPTNFDSIHGVELDGSFNKYIAAPEISKFTRIINECSINIPYANERVIPDFEQGACRCLRGDHGIANYVNEENILAAGHRHKYRDIYEKGRYEPDEPVAIDNDPKVFLQPDKPCSACAYGFVKTVHESTGLPTSVVAKPLRQTTFENEYEEHLLNVPVSCVTPKTPVDKDTFRNNWLNVRMCRENTMCVNTLLDISLGLSRYAKKIVRENKF